MEQEIIDIIRVKFKRTCDINSDSRLKEDLNLDSLDLSDLFFILNNKYPSLDKAPVDSIYKISTVREMAEELSKYAN